MTEPLSLTVIAGALLSVVEVAGAVASIIGLALTFFEFGAIVLFFIIKFIVTVIVQFIYGISMFFIVPFQGCFGFLFFKSAIFIKDIQADRFDFPAPSKRLSSVSIFTIINQMFSELRTIAEDLFVYITPLIAAFPFLLILLVVLYGSAALTIPLTYIVFIGVDVFFNVFTTSLKFLAISLNVVEDFRAGFAPVINGTVDFIFEFLVLAFQISCPGVPLTGDMQHDCPGWYTLWTILKTSSDFYASLWRIVWGLLSDFLVAFGQYICPAGVCPINLCQQLMGTSTCVWSFVEPIFMVTVLFSYIKQIIIGLTQLVFIQILFILDIIKIFSVVFASVLSKYLSPSLYATLQANIANYPSLASFGTTPEYVALKTFFLTFEGIASTFFYILSNTFNSALNIIDLVFCNLFVQPVNCGMGKICAYFPSITIPLTTIVLDLNQIICINVLHVDKWLCLATCDHCSFLPFGIASNAKFWDFANIQNFGTLAGYWFGPCDIASGCCIGSISLIQHIFP